MRAIAAAIIVATGIVVTASTVILATNLNRQLDDSVTAAMTTGISTLSTQFPDATDLSGVTVADIFPVSAGSLNAVIFDGKVTSSALLDQDYNYRPLTTDEQSSLLKSLQAGESFFVVPIGAERYRSLATGYEIGETGTPIGGYFVSGIQENPIYSTIAVFLASTVATALLVTLIAALLAYRMVRRAMLPLDRVVEVADQVASMPLSEGAIVLDRRIPAADLHDATEEGRVGLALNRLLENVESSLDARHRTEEAMRRFVAEASHELRNPLASIRGYADHYATSPGLSTDARQAFVRVGAESARLGSLVEELLTLAKLDAGRILQRSDVDLSLLVLESAADARMAAPDHEWRIVLGTTPVIAMADESALRQVLVNLCANAGAHTPAGTIVTVSARADAHFAHLEVSDNGPGIAANVLPMIFDRFSQGDTGTQMRSRKTGSVGLGLAIVAAIAKASGGRIEARSIPGTTTFRLSVPVSPGVEQDGAPA